MRQKPTRFPYSCHAQFGISGVGDPPGEVRIVRHRDLAALVSDIDPDLPLGRPDDLVAHEELLDASAADVPVLPLRFGSVVTSDEAVTSSKERPYGLMRKWCSGPGTRALMCV